MRKTLSLVLAMVTILSSLFCLSSCKTSGDSDISHIDGNPIVAKLSDNPFVEQTVHINGFENYMYILEFNSLLISTTYQIKCSCNDTYDYQRHPFGETVVVSDDNTITGNIPSSHIPHEIVFAVNKEREYDITFSPLLTEITSLGTTTVTNANVYPDGIAPGSTLVDFTPQESGKYELSDTLSRVLYEKDDGYGIIDFRDKEGAKKVDLEKGKRYIFELKFDSAQTEFTINKIN